LFSLLYEKGISAETHLPNCAASAPTISPSALPQAVALVGGESGTIW